MDIYLAMAIPARSLADRGQHDAALACARKAAAADPGHPDARNRLWPAMGETRSAKSNVARGHWR